MIRHLFYIGCAFSLLMLSTVAWGKKTFDDSLPLLNEASQALANNNLSWLQYHIPILPAKKREPLLYVLLSQYYQFDPKPSPTLVPWLQSIAKERPTLSETTLLDGYQVVRPRYDYPSLARAILGHWRLVERRQQYANELREGSLPWQKIFSQDNPSLFSEQQSVVYALSQLDAKQLRRSWQKITAHQYYFPDNSVLSAIAYHLNDDKLLALLFAQPVDQYTVDTLHQIAAHYRPERALAIFKKLLDNKQLLSYSFDAIALLAKRYPKARLYLLQQKEKGPYNQEALNVLRQHKLIQT